MLLGLKHSSEACAEQQDLTRHWHLEEVRRTSKPSSTTVSTALKEHSFIEEHERERGISAHTQKNHVCSVKSLSHV